MNLITKNSVLNVGLSLKEKILGAIAEIKSLANKKVCIFSPHTDDSDLGAGGLIPRLRELDSNVHVGNCVSGHNAVRDRDIIALKRILFETNSEGKFSDQDLKTIVRESEGRNTFKVYGIPETNISFLRLGFYNNEAPNYESDVGIVTNYINVVNPHAVFVESALLDPHGTHEICYRIIGEALRRTNLSPRIFLYRSVWKSFPISKATLIIPFSRKIAKIKREAILCHQSQLFPMFPGNDKREFVERAEERDADTASIINFEIGSEYYGAELFVEVDKLPLPYQLTF